MGHAVMCYSANVSRHANEFPFLYTTGREEDLFFDKVAHPIWILGLLRISEIWARSPVTVYHFVLQITVRVNLAFQSP
jgi:hypothetical protein